MHKIYYDIKHTTAKTEYLHISDQDIQIVHENILGILAYMSELSLSNDKDIRDFANWFKKPKKQFLYNSKLKRSNSPQSLLAGVINNIVFGDQRDFSLVQLEAIESIINTSIDIIEELERVKQIKLQSQPQFVKIFIQENLWGNQND